MMSLLSQALTTPRESVILCDMETTTREAQVTTYSESAYVAYGKDEESDEVRYWIAVWDDDGPQSNERFADTLEIAQSVATIWAENENLEAIEVDEFGAVISA